MIPFSDVNLVAVIVATVVSIGLGMAWYSPALFGTRWMKLMKIDPKSADKSDMGRAMGIGFTSTLVSVYVLAVLLGIFLPQSYAEALIISLLFWIAFTAPANLNRVAWEQSSWELFWINSLQLLAALLVSSAILYAMS